MTLNATIVVGDPQSRSRTFKVAEPLVEKLLEPRRFELEIVDLADHSAEIFAWPSEDVTALNARVAVSDFAVLASPTYFVASQMDQLDEPVERAAMEYADNFAALSAIAPTTQRTAVSAN